MTRSRRALRSLPFAAALLAGTACSPAQPQPMTSAEAQVIGDSVIALERATNLAVDRLDCTAAFANVDADEPAFVSGGHVVRTQAAFRRACDAIVAPRTGAVFATDTVTAHALGRDAAFVVREGVYTVNMKDGSTRRSRLIMTSIWARKDGVWKMVHLHESSPPPVP